MVGTMGGVAVFALVVVIVLVCLVDTSWWLVNSVDLWILLF